MVLVLMHLFKFWCLGGLGTFNVYSGIGHNRTERWKIFDIEMGMVSVVSMAKDLDLAYCDFVQAATDYHELCDQEQMNKYRIVNGLIWSSMMSNFCKDSITACRTYVFCHHVLPRAQYFIHQVLHLNLCLLLSILRRGTFSHFLANTRTDQSSKIFGNS